MGKIKVLDDHTINQIAAGEVIENPASIVKELLENSRDAGASQIVIETKGGGRFLIRVSDNGHGMGEDDLLLALERHATSKIRTAEDLSSILTMGFRGEALASIAAVSKIMLHSSPGERGAYVVANGGKIQGIYPKPRQQGTSIEVRELFYNVPARKAFQKSVASDTSEIHKVITKFALSAPEIGLTWIHDEKIERELPARQSSLERISALLGTAFSEQLISIGEMGWIGQPTAHRPNRLGQYLMLNDRPVVSPWIAQMVLENYGTRLPAGRFPLFVLNLHLPPTWIDVNVHPQKREVRLREQSDIAQRLKEAIQPALQKKQTFVCQPALQSEGFTFSVREEPVVYEVSKPIFPEEKMVRAMPLIIGLFSPYLLLEKEGGLQLLDLRRALFRIHYDKLKKESVPQALLIPHTLEVSEEEKSFLLEHQPELAGRGLLLRHFGGRTFIVEAIPPWVEVADLDVMIHELIERGLDHCAFTLAKWGKRGNYRLEEATSILQQLMRSQCPEIAPDGSPITAIVSKEELDGKFR